MSFIAPKHGFHVVHDTFAAITSDNAAIPRGSTVFAQLKSLIPRHQFNSCVTRFNGDYRIKNFSCYDHILVMGMAQYTNKKSLRLIEANRTAAPINSITAALDIWSLALWQRQMNSGTSRINRVLEQVLIDKVRPLFPS